MDSNRTYVSQHTPTIFIGGYWLDDAQALEFQVSDPKEPLYGFRDRQFRTVAQGQTIVHGMLDINFRYKGYLSLVLQKISERQRKLQAAGFSLDNANQTIPVSSFSGYGVSTSQAADGLVTVRNIQQAELGNDFESQGIDPTRLSPEAYKAFLERPFEQFDIKGFTKLSEAVRQQFWDANGGNDAFQSSVGTQVARPRAGLFPFGFDMSIVYDHSDPRDRTANLDDSRVEILRGCHIVGMSKMITNTVPGGGRAIVERYQFIAREVE